MKKIRERNSWIVLTAVLLLFAACKGETPTAPPSGGGIPPGGSTPPTGVALSLAASNSTPLVDSTVTITATVSDNGSPVPNGTAVEFSSSSGVLNGSGTSVLRTTTNGVSTITLTSSSPATVRVSATVNNVTRTVDVAFSAKPVIEPPIPETVSITSISPNTGRPAGGEIIRITGTNFKTPVRVLFDLGGIVPVEASVVAVTSTTIDVITPPTNLGSGQEFAADIIVFTQAGTATEQRVSRADGFTYRNVSLTPIISTITPNSGPVTGGTRVTIIGEGFQDPVQVLFNTAEARVLNVTYNQILVETPAGRDTSPTGSDVVTGPVTVTVRNIKSNTSVDLGGGFLYKAAMAITGVTVSGSNSTAGGARLTIEGIGFVPPLIVVVRTGSGDIGLSQVAVAGTRIIAITPTVIPESCDDDLRGPIVVTNIANGDQATGPIFTFAVIEPAIISINPAAVTIGVNTTFNVTVANPLPGFPRFRIGTRTVFPTTTVVNGDDTVTYSLPVPSNVTFPTEACGTGGTRQLPAELDVTYVPGVTGCDDTLQGGLVVSPASNACVLPPAPEVSVVSAPTNGSGCAVPPNAAVGNTTNATITFSNTGDAPLIVTLGAITGVNAADFNVTPATRTIAPASSDTFTVSFSPTVPPPGIRNASVLFSTNDTDDGESSIPICLQATVNP